MSFELNGRLVELLKQANIQEAASGPEAVPGIKFAPTPPSPSLPPIPQL